MPEASSVSTPGDASRWPHFLLNGSEMGRRICELDWAQTPLGPIDEWPSSLRHYVGMLVENEVPMYIFWGLEHVAIYNDGYIPLAGNKHAAMLGSRTQDCWREVWPFIGPLLDRVYGGHAVTIVDTQLILQRYNFQEEAYFTFCYSPLREGDGRIAGVLATLTETTPQVLAHRRLETLRDLAFRASLALDEKESIERVAQTLERSPDVRFASIYVADQGTMIARLTATVGAVPSSGLRREIDLAELHPSETDDLEASADGCLMVPIAGQDGSGIVGVLIAAPNPHLRLDEGYREFFTMVGAQIANTIASARVLSEERDRAEARYLTRTVDKLQLFAESWQQLFWMTRADGYVIWYNRGWYDYTGQTPEEARGWGWQAVHHPDDSGLIVQRWPEHIAAREPFEMTFRLRGKDGRYRWFLTRAVPELDEEGAVIRWYGTNTNIDTERRAAQQLDFFARLGDRLMQSLDRRGALAALCDALVPELADWTLINLADAHGNLILHAAHHRDPEKAATLRPFVGKDYTDPSRSSAATMVMKTGAPLLLAAIQPEVAYDRVSNDFAATVVSVGMRSAVIAPIVADGAVIGTFHALSSTLQNAYSASDVPFFEEIGRRIGYALRNAEAYERESRIAHAFQSAALPAQLPAVPGIAFSSIYEPASNEANVGGDFYDAFRLLDGRVVVSIGDVAGAGLGAAATMAALRQSIRAVASVNPDPEMLLRAADGVFSDANRAPFASAFVAVIEPLNFTMRYANAGHPPPMLRAPDGSVTVLNGSDLLLGISGDSHPGGRYVGKLVAGEGSLLVLYTDGLSEATRRPLEGERLVHEAVAGLSPDTIATGSPAEAICKSVLGRDRPTHDDVAVITVSMQSTLMHVVTEKVPSWHFSCDDAEAAHRARDEMLKTLRTAGLLDEELFAAAIVFAELTGNVLRHAGGFASVALDLSQRAPVLHVLDDGGGFSINPKLPADAYAERGRGLFIITQFSREFTVTPRTLTQGSHARAVLHRGGQ